MINFILLLLGVWGLRDGSDETLEGITAELFGKPTAAELMLSLDKTAPVNIVGLKDDAVKLKAAQEWLGRAALVAKMDEAKQILEKSKLEMAVVGVDVLHPTTVSSEMKEDQKRPIHKTLFAVAREIKNSLVRWETFYFIQQIFVFTVAFLAYFFFRIMFL